ncbi:MAG: sugar ABC transporter substrate-binding protein [Muricoprocola sp.]
MKKKLRNEVVIVLVVMFLLILFFFAQKDRNKIKEENITIGISFSDCNTAWNVSALKSILKACDDRKISTLWKSANGSNRQQEEDIKELMNHNPQYLIVMPGQNVGLKEVLESVASKTKIILFYGSVTGLDEKNIYWEIGSDSYAQGSLAAELIADYLGKRQGSILELQSNNAFSETKEKAIGFRDELCKYDNLEIGYVMRDLDKRIDAYNAIVSYMVDGKEKVDAIFAYGDDAAMGAIAALETLEKEIPIVAIGGTQDTRKAVLAGKLYAVIEVNSDAGEMIADRIMADLEGKKYNGKETLEFWEYTYDDVKDVQ